jgi:hypothetical protein
VLSCYRSVEAIPKFSIQSGKVLDQVLRVPQSFRALEYLTIDEIDIGADDTLPVFTSLAHAESYLPVPYHCSLGWWSVTIRKLQAVDSFHSIQADLADLSLEDAILGLLSPESISQAEASLEIYFTKPNALELIQPLLLSSDLRIRQSAFVLLPRVIKCSQANSRPLPTTLSQTLWEIFLLFDDPSYLLTTWTVIGPTLRHINPDSFIQSVFEYFQICCKHNKAFHAIILGH